MLTEIMQRLCVVHCNIRSYRINHKKSTAARACKAQCLALSEFFSLARDSSFLSTHCETHTARAQTPD